MKNFLSLSAVFVMFLMGCGGSGNLDENSAAAIISSYLKSNPSYETATIKIGDVKFRSDNDKDDLVKYKSLEKKDFFQLKLQKQKKKFLSKDSVYFYSIYLTDKSKPYVLKQDDNNAKVRAVDYMLDKDKPIIMINGDSKIAQVTVSLKKEKNAFSVFLKERGTSSNFITKTYKLKFKKDNWIVVGD